MSPMNRRDVLAILGGSLLAACFSDRPTTGPGDEDVEVTMTPQLRFEPSTVEIEVGETVVWTNPAAVVHTVTADPELAQDADRVELPVGAAPFHSGSIPEGGEYRRTFAVAGTYRYVCLPHETQGMVGTVIVGG